MHRFTQILCAATLVSFAAACNDTNAPVALPSTAAAPAVSASDAPAATPTPRASSSAPPTSQPGNPAHTDLANLTVDPSQIGPLRIGMSLAAAKSTGLIVVNAGQGTVFPDSCISAHWKGQSDRAWMVFNGKYGLRALDSFGGQKTPEGIKPGSTLAAVRLAYPRLTWRVDGDQTPAAQRTAGDALVDAVKGDGAHYRINIQHGKVTDVQLESDRAGCYE